MKEGRKIVGEAKGGEGREKEVEVVEQGSRDERKEGREERGSGKCERASEGQTQEVQAVSGRRV